MKLRTAALLLVALEAALYAPSLADSFVIDDGVYIVENPAVTRGAPLRDDFLDPATTSSDPALRTQVYRPLRTLGFRALARLFGVRPAPFRVANLVGYALSTVLALWLLARLTGDAAAAAWAAALWAAAPVHVESVVYASALGDQISLAAELGAIAASLLALDRAPAGRVLHRRWAAASALLAAAAMLAKEMAVTGVLLVGAAALLTGRRRGAARLVLLHGAVTAGFLALRTAVLRQVGQAPVTVAGAARELSLLPVRLGAYVKISVAPLGHIPSYVLPWPGAAWIAFGWLALAVVTAWLLRRGTAVKLGAAWFFLGLLPVLGVVPVLADLADRFALVPSLGLALVAAAAASALGPRLRRFLPVGAAALLALYAAATLVEAAAWKDELSLWSKAAAIEPRSAQAHANLGTALLTASRMEEALRELDQARALGRVSWEVELHRAFALHSLGRDAEAEAAVVASLGDRSDVGRAHALYGELLVGRGDLGGAERERKAAAALSPEHPSVALLEARLDLARGDLDGADRTWEALIARFPDEPRFLYLWARALLERGDPRAAKLAAECLARAPDHPECAAVLGLCGAAHGDPAAGAALDRAIAGLPDGPERRACVEARARLAPRR